MVDLGNEYFWISHKISDLLTPLGVRPQWFETDLSHSSYSAITMEYCLATVYFDWSKVGVPVLRKKLAVLQINLLLTITKTALERIWPNCVKRLKSRTMDARWSLFSSKSQTFGFGQTNWTNNFWGIWGIFGWTISTHVGTVSPLSMFFVNEVLFALQKAEP